MSTSKVNASTQRWISELSEFSFSINYKPGTQHAAPDCLSRIPLQIDPEEFSPKFTKEIDNDAFRAIVAGIEIQGVNEESWVQWNQKHADVMPVIRKGEIVP